jgi:hypothetical protein
MTRYRLDPVFDRTPDGAVIGIIRYDIYLDGHFVGSRRRHALCHEYLDELMPSTPEPGRATATIHQLRRPIDPCHHNLDELRPSTPVPGRATATVHELRRRVDV